jgi:hypothetical protein
MGHAIQHGRDVDDVSRRRLAEPPVSHASNIHRTAVCLWDEFDADALTVRVSRLLLKTSNGQAIDIADYLAPGFLNSAVDLLAAFCDFTRNDVQGYRTGCVSLDALYPRAAPLLGELFVALTHAAALYGECDRLDELTDALMSARGFQSYLAEDWELLLDALATARCGSEAATRLVPLLDRVLRRMGLVITDLPNGRLFVRVEQPADCA